METLMPEQAWSMRITNGLSAHFKMPEGPSREGTLWSVNLVRGDEHYVATVKGLLADNATKATRKDDVYQSQTALLYLNDQLNNGWHPRDEIEHTIQISNPLSGQTATHSTIAKPWWRSW